MKYIRATSSYGLGMPIMWAKLPPKSRSESAGMWMSALYFMR